MLDLTPRVAGYANEASLEYRSRCLFHWMARSVGFVAESGHVGTFVGNGGSYLDSNGATVTAATYWPRFEPRNDGVRSAQHWLTGTSDRAQFITPGGTQVDFLLQAMAGGHVFIEQGGIAVTNGALFAIANDAVTGQYVCLDSTGTFYRLRYYNGTATATATLAVAPTNGQRVRVWWQLAASGALTLSQSINEAAATTASAGAPSGGLVAALPAGAKVCINSKGTATMGAAAHQVHKLVAGTPSVARLFALY